MDSDIFGCIGTVLDENCYWALNFFMAPRYVVRNRLVWRHPSPGYQNIPLKPRSISQIVRVLEYNTRQVKTTHRLGLGRNLVHPFIRHQLFLVGFLRIFDLSGFERAMNIATTFRNGYSLDKNDESSQVNYRNWK